MATFLPNITDVFAGNSEYNPDWNRIERTLKYKEQLYQQGAKRIKTMYDSLFSSTMMREDNIKTRDAYLKTITESLNRISAMDLSLEQNQQLATSLFTPILEDAYIPKDIMFTKQYQNEVSKANQYLSSSDPKTRKLHWEDGVKALHYQAEDFKNADRETALSMSAPRYVPKVELTEWATEAYKKAGISVKEDIASGGYIYTKKNGDAVFPISKNYVEMLFSEDAGIKEMLRTQAYVERKDFIKQNAITYGSEKKAEIFYLKNIIKNAGKTFQKKVDENNEDLKKLRIKKESWDEKIRTQGIIPGSAEHQEYLADLDKIQMLEKGIETQKSSVFSSNTLDFNNINDLRAQADNLVMFANYSLLTNQMGLLLSSIGAEYTMKADPIYLAQLNASLSLSNQKEMEKTRHLNKKEIIDYQHEKAKELIKERAKYKVPEEYTDKDKENEEKNNPWNTPSTPSEEESLPSELEKPGSSMEDAD